MSTAGTRAAEACPPTCVAHPHPSSAWQATPRSRAPGRACAAMWSSRWVGGWVWEPHRFVTGGGGGAPHCACARGWKGTAWKGTCGCMGQAAGRAADVGSNRWESDTKRQFMVGRARALWSPLRPNPSLHSPACTLCTSRTWKTVPPPRPAHPRRPLQDNHSAGTTVREALQFSARLRLTPDVSAQQVRGCVGAWVEGRGPGQRPLHRAALWLGGQAAAPPHGPSTALLCLCALSPVPCPPASLSTRLLLLLLLPRVRAGGAAGGGDPGNGGPDLVADQHRGLRGCVQAASQGAWMREAAHGSSAAPATGQPSPA